MSGSTDPDTSETSEWLDSLRAVLHHQGPARAAYLLARLTDEAYRVGIPEGARVRVVIRVRDRDGIQVPEVASILPPAEER
jgi:pyruvate dehydrogenase complex dehydrogenase (E1) component